MASFDVFLAYAPADQETAALVARRLRALKFKVRFNKRGEAPAFDDKDARDALRSQSMLVLWSADAVKSDWVRAAASVGQTRVGMLVEAALDKAVPQEPFRSHKRFDLSGFTARKNVEGWYQTVEELGRRDGRKHLREWIDIPAKDEESKTEWLAAHPTDPLALHAEMLREKKRGSKPARSSAAAGAAALTATAIGQGRANPAPVSARPKANGQKAAAPMPQHSDTGEDRSRWLVPLVLAGITGFFLLSWQNSSRSLTGSPAIANGRLVQSGATCPVGTIPANLLAPRVLETGPITNDTE